MTNEYPKGNLTEESIVVLVVMTDESEEELLLKSYLYLNHKKVFLAPDVLSLLSSTFSGVSYSYSTIFPWTNFRGNFPALNF